MIGMYSFHLWKQYFIPACENFKLHLLHSQYSNDFKHPISINKVMNTKQYGSCKDDETDCCYHPDNYKHEIIIDRKSVTWKRYHLVSIVIYVR